MKILSLAFSNFYSFYEEAEMTFATSSKKPMQGNGFAALPNNIHVSLASVILGANGSGKTNALKTLPFLSWFACYSHENLDNGENIHYENFVFAEDEEENTIFNIIFEHRDKIYAYDLEIRFDKKVVASESIRMLNYDTNRFKMLIRRERAKDGEYSFSKGDIGISLRVLKEFLRDNCSILSASRKIKNSGLETVWDAFSCIYANINTTGRALNDVDKLSTAAQLFRDNERYMGIVEDVIKSVDLGISKLVYKKIDLSILPDKIVDFLKSTVENFDEDDLLNTYAVYAVHSVEGKDYELSMMYESGGTKELFCILQYIVPALENGGVAVIDELEMGLHPHMVEKIVELFSDTACNNKGAQLIASTHSATIVDGLDGRQIFLVEKDSESLQSEIWRISDIKGVSSRENYYRAYMSGKYGAVPRI